MVSQTGLANKGNIMLNINLFGGPGTGKSTTAAELFSRMKASQYKVELLQEYAKDLTYGKDTVKLSDQLHVLGEQHHRLFRLHGAVDYVIHDSPFIMGLAYLDPNGIIPVNSFKVLTLELFHRYNNLNILLVRNTDKHPYQEYGRTQSLVEAKNKDKFIEQLLIDNAIPFIKMTVSDTTTEDILKNLK